MADLVFIKGIGENAYQVRYGSLTGKTKLFINEALMPHLRSVDKGAFPLLSEGVTPLIRVIKWLNFTPKTTKI